jgi:hypothetical protein
MLMLDHQLARDNEDDMAFVTPAVGNVIRAVVNQTKADISKLAHTHRHATRLTRMHRRSNLGPIRDADRQIVEIHVVALKLPFFGCQAGKIANFRAILLNLWNPDA